MITLVTVLKKLAGICWRVLNGDQCRIFFPLAVGLVCTTDRVAGKGKIRIQEIGNNAYSVLDNPRPTWEKPPPFVGVT